MFGSDLKIRVTATGLATYPDVTVVCGGLELDPEDPKGHTVTNPRLIVEVLSPSTEEYDRGEKLAHYQRMASLQEVVLIAHDEQRVQVWRRRSQDWLEDTARGEASAELRSVGCQLPLSANYSFLPLA